jgi:hypothetical protein
METKIIIMKTQNLEIEVDEIMKIIITIQIILMKKQKYLI